MRAVWVTPRHSRTSRVPGLKETDGGDLAAPGTGGGLRRLRGGGFREAAIRPLLKLINDPSDQEVAGEPHRRRHAMKPPPLAAQLEDGRIREPHERLCDIDRRFVHVTDRA